MGNLSDSPLQAAVSARYDVMWLTGVGSPATANAHSGVPGRGAVVWQSRILRAIGKMAGEGVDLALLRTRGTAGHLASAHFLTEAPVC